MKHEAQVVLYRSYRRGDLPDIQIPHSSLITPLQAVAQVSMEPAHTLGLLPLTGSKGDLSLGAPAVPAVLPVRWSAGMCVLWEFPSKLRGDDGALPL